jgi:DNA-binding transcriptional regulator YiaG
MRATDFRRYRDPPENDITPREILELRKRLGLSQEQFSERIGASVDTLKSWETGRRHPSGTARKALRDLAAMICEKSPSTCT